MKTFADLVDALDDAKASIPGSPPLLRFEIGFLKTAAMRLVERIEQYERELAAAAPING